MRRKPAPKDDPEELEETWALLQPTPEKSYVGRRNKAGKCEVKIVFGDTTRNLPLCTRVWNHARGFEWSYAGSGPAQLALAILVDCLGDVERAKTLHQKFKCKVIAGLPQQGWELPESIVKSTIETIEREVP
jgi:hypothetical protein